jgi:hypothetical protein
MNTYVRHRGGRVKFFSLWFMIFTFSTFVEPIIAEAAIRLVSTTGVDNADCSVAECRHIQFAINQAASGDTVLAAAGTYAENVVLKPGVYVLSNQSATIQGNGLTQVVEASGTGPGTILEGFVITGGNIGIVIFNASAEIRRNVIVNNNGTQAGGIFVGNSSAVIVNNLIRGNSATADGGAIEIEFCPGSVSIVNNTIDGNSASNVLSIGQAIGIVDSNVLVQNNIISNHSTFPKTAIGVSGNAPLLRNNLFFNNAGLYSSEGGPLTLPALNALGSNGGNIQGNPLYANAIGGDFHLLAGSPAINTGLLSGAPSVDFDSDARPLGGAVDIGFDESLFGSGGGHSMLRWHRQRW